MGMPICNQLIASFRTAAMLTNLLNMIKKKYKCEIVSKAPKLQVFWTIFSEHKPSHYVPALLLN